MGTCLVTMPDGGSFCHKCGSPLPPGAAFCPRCGAAAVSAPAATYVAQQPGTRARNEWGEKHEKHEKREKNEKGEKSTHGGMLGPVVGGLVLIWLGVTFYLEQNGNLPSDIWWAYFVAGVGIILIFEGVVIFARGRFGIGPVIGGALLVFAGLSAIATRNYTIPSQMGALAIIIMGVLVLVAGLTFRRRVPAP